MMKPSTVIFLFILLILTFSKQTFCQERKGIRGEINAFIDELIGVQKKVKSLKNFSPIQKLTSGELIVFTSPHTAINPHVFKNTELNGWVTDKDMEKVIEWTTSNQWMLYDLTSQFRPLPKASLVVLNKKPFDPYIPNTSCPSLKKKEWYQKWVVYPGDYLCDTYSACVEKTTQPPELTLIYFSPRSEGKNVYFGLRKDKEHWVLYSIFRDYDTCGG